MVVNIIHLPNDARWPHREERLKSVIQELIQQGCDFKFWPGIICNPRLKGIHLAHRQIIQDAKERNFPFVCVAEDDLKFSALGAWDYFIANMPIDFDIYAGSEYTGEKDPESIRKHFSGLTLYVVAQKFYDIFLSLNENRHIDKAIGASGADIKFPPLYVCYQMAGFSEQRNKFVDDSKRMIGKEFFK